MTAARGVLFAVLALAIGCAPRNKASAPDSASPAFSSQPDDLATAEAELARNAADLEALGVVVAQRGSPTHAEPGTDPEKNDPPPPDLTKRPEPGMKRPDVENPDPAVNLPTTPDGDEDDPSPTASEQTPCQRICTLAGVACDLSQRICTLAAQHEGNARYEDVCWNAERQCEEASDACSDCSACGV